MPSVFFLPIVFFFKCVSQPCNFMNIIDFCVIHKIQIKISPLFFCVCCYYVMLLWSDDCCCCFVVSFVHPLQCWGRLWSYWDYHWRAPTLKFLKYHLSWITMFVPESYIFVPFLCTKLACLFCLTYCVCVACYVAFEPFPSQFWMVVDWTAFGLVDWGTVFLLYLLCMVYIHLLAFQP